MNNSYSRDRNDRSLCEKSMKVVVNIVKLSSFSIAKMSLGGAAATKNPGSVSEDAVLLAKEPLLLSPSPVSRKSEKPKNSLNPVSYLMEPRKGNESSYVIHEDKKSVIDGKASAYIRKVHQKNSKALSESSSNLPQFIVPPPPPPRPVV